MKKTTRVLTAVLTAAMTAAAAMPAMASETPSDPITDFYTYQTTANEMETFNILYSQYSKELDVLTNCIDGLVSADEYGKLIPALAESWETEDNGKTWTFHLRQGVKWVDVNGEEKADVTAQDWLTGMEWILNFYKNDANNTSMPLELLEGASEYYDYTKELSEDEAKALTASNEKFQELVGVKAIDDYTVQYTCLTEKPYFDTVAAYNCLYPASQALIDELGVDGFKACTNENMWYCGAYTMTSYTQGNEKVLTKNPTYWDTDCTLFDSVTIKMVESLDTAYQLYLSGEIDNVELTESNLSTIYNNTSDENNANLVEMRPRKYSYKIQFNFAKNNADGTKDENWNKAVANEAFRQCWYYGLELGNYYKRVNAINPYKCYNNSYTMKGLVYYSDGTEYTDKVQEKLGYGSYDGETMSRYDKEKFEELKAQAIEELTAEGVTFPIVCDYYIQASSQTALDSANVLKQTFTDCFGDDFVTLNIGTYVSSFAKEIRTPQLHSITINGWGADYGDPQNYLGQERIDEDNAFYSMSYSFINDADDEDLKATFQEFTDMVNAADAVTDDLDKRYDAYADAEVYYIQHALAVPCYFYISWELTHVNDYSKANAMFGIQNNKYKNWVTSKAGFSAADYEQFAADYEAGLTE